MTVESTNPCVEMVNRVASTPPPPKPQEAPSQAAPVPLPANMGSRIDITA